MLALTRSVSTLTATAMPIAAFSPSALPLAEVSTVLEWVAVMLTFYAGSNALAAADHGMGLINDHRDRGHRVVAMPPRRQPRPGVDEG